MASNSQNTFTDNLVERYKKAQQTTYGTDALERKVAYARMDEILAVLGDYYRTVLKRPNTKAQAAHCIAQIRNLSPGYAEGLTTKMKTVKP